MTPFVADPDFTLYVGDVRDCLRDLEPGSVHTCVTSPPYWGLRDYGATGQLGLEATPEAYVAAMVDVFREVRRVLRDDGTLWLNLGDSYAGSWGNQGRKEERGTQRPINGEMLTPVLDGRYPSKGSNTGAVPPGLKPKDLVGIPWRVAFALQADGWYLRSDIIWAKPNPMPESVTDRPTKSHEYLFLLAKQPRYFFDQEAVREPLAPGNWHPSGAPKFGNAPQSGTAPPGAKNPNTYTGNRASRIHPEAGRNVRSVWEIATQPFSARALGGGSDRIIDHFAVFPEAIPDRCIRAGSSERGCCPECGAPWEREVERTPMEVRPTPKRAAWQAEDDHARTQMGGTMLSAASSTTTGWRPTCECPTDGTGFGETIWAPPPPVPCTVLDPFMGSGTTAYVARKLGRRSIGIELSPEYAALCARRLQQQSLFAGDAA